MDLDSIKDTIINTRKSRIIAAERFKKRDNFFHFINIYYSVFVVVLSIINLNLKDPNGHLSSSLLVISILAFTFSIVISSLNLKEKYYNFKNNYIAMSKLISNLDKLNTNSVQQNQLEKIKEEYDLLLETSENHDELDYYNYIYFQNREKFNKKSDFEKSLIMKKVYLDKIFDVLIKILLVLLPWVLGYVINIIKISLLTLS